MSWLSDILSPDQWSAEPVATAGKAVVCTIGAPVCIAVEISERNAAEAEAQRLRVEAAARESRGTLGNILHDAGESGDQFLDRVQSVSDAASQTAMWISIAIIAIFLIVLIGAIIYFALPFVAFAKA